MRHVKIVIGNISIRDEFAFTTVSETGAKSVGITWEKGRKDVQLHSNWKAIKLKSRFWLCVTQITITTANGGRNMASAEALLEPHNYPINALLDSAHIILTSKLQSVNLPNVMQIIVLWKFILKKLSLLKTLVYS